MLQELSFSTSKKQEMIDITDKVKAVVKKSKIKQGICLVYVAHATAAIIITTTITDIHIELFFDFFFLAICYHP